MTNLSFTLQGLSYIFISKAVLSTTLYDYVYGLRTRKE